MPFCLSACSYKNSQLSSVCYTPVKMAPHTDIKEAQFDPHVWLPLDCLRKADTWCRKINGLYQCSNSEHKHGKNNSKN